MFAARTGRKGIPPGEYKVRLCRYIGPDGAALPSNTKTLDNPGVRQSIPPKYYLLDNNPLRFTVGESGGEFNIEVPEGLITGKDVLGADPPPRRR